MIDKWLTVNEIAGLLSRSKARIIQRSQKENWPYRSHAVRGGKERRYRVSGLPQDVQIAYAASVDLTFESFQNELKPPQLRKKRGHIDGFNGSGAKTPDVAHYDNLIEKWRDVAKRRLALIMAYSESGRTARDFVAAYNAGELAPALRADLGPHGDIRGASSLYRWMERYEAHGLAGLAPQYKGKGGGHSLPQEAKDRLEWLYLDSSRPSVAAVCRLLEQYGLTACETTARRYINSIPNWLKDKHRMGRDYFKAKYLPYIERDYTKYKPMEIICGDYVTQDFVCRKGDRVLRARLCAFMDMRSRGIVGWNLQETANSVGVMRTLKMAFDDHGLPETVYVDNGSEFKNYILCGDEWKAQKTKIDPELLDLDIGILAECGVKIVFAQAYNGQAKPIERLWRFLHDNLDRFMPSYTGSNTADRPDEAKAFRSNVAKMKKEDLDKIPSFEDVEKKIGNFIKWYNETWKHSGQGMDGRTPMEVFAEFAGPRREIPEHIKKYLFTMRYARTVQRNGINLDGIWFQHPRFIEHAGRKVEVRRSIDDAGLVHVFSHPDRVHLFDAEALIPTGIVAEDMARKKKLAGEIRELDKKRAAKKAEYDKGPFITPAERYAEQAAAEVQLKVVNGEPLAADKRPELKLVKAAPKKKRLNVLDHDWR